MTWRIFSGNVRGQRKRKYNNRKNCSGKAEGFPTGKNSINLKPRTRENWVSVFTTTRELEAGIVKDLLDEAGIPAVILNQKDSSYQTFGDISVMVSRDDQEEAKKVIKDYYDRE